jgi:hypothetical protein
MSAPLVRRVTPDLALLDAAIDDPPALGRALGCEVAEGWDVFPKALRLGATRSSPVQRLHRAGRVAASPPQPFARFCAKRSPRRMRGQSSRTLWSSPAPPCVCWRRPASCTMQMAKSGELKMAARRYKAA